MTRVLLEGGIIILLVLIGISIFIPSGDSVNDVIIEFENSLGSGDVVEDGNIKDVEVSFKDSSNLISRINCKIANTIVNGLNSVFDLGMNFIRKVIN